jgi:hypothetical protein
MSIVVYNYEFETTRFDFHIQTYSDSISSNNLKILLQFLANLLSDIQLQFLCP